MLDNDLFQINTGFPVRYNEVEGNQQDGNDERDKPEEFSETLKFQFERRFRCLSLSNVARNFSKFGLHARGDNQAQSSTGRNRRTHERHVVAVCQEGANWKTVRGFSDGQGLTRQRRFINFTLLGPYESNVCRNIEPLFKTNDIARYKIRCRHFTLEVTSNDHTVRNRHLLQGIHGLFGLIFLPEAKERICCQHDEDEDGIAGVIRIDGECDQCGADQQIVERVVVLGKESEKRRGFFGLVEFVGTVACSPHNHFIHANAVFRRLLSDEAV